jgi:hypothetical protein
VYAARTRCPFVLPNDPAACGRLDCCWRKLLRRAVRRQLACGLVLGQVPNLCADLPVRAILFFDRLVYVAQVFRPEVLRTLCLRTREATSKYEMYTNGFCRSDSHSN